MLDHSEQIDVIKEGKLKLQFEIQSSTNKKHIKSNLEIFENLLKDLSEMWIMDLSLELLNGKFIQNLAY